MTTNEKSSTQHGSARLVREQGAIGYDVAGDGPLVLLVPGMGDLRAGYRFLAPLLREHGYRVASTDLRGHGDSDTTFTSYGDRETAEDILALIEELEGSAVVVGNSMGAAAAVIAAAQRPDLIDGLVLVGPFVRNGDIGFATRLMLRVAMARPWAVSAWKAYMPKLYAGKRPIDFDRYREQVVASLRRPGYAAAFAKTTRLDHAPAEESLSAVSKPTLVVMGDQDPDFPNPQGEAEWIAQALDAQVAMIAQAGHYPQSQQPQETAQAVLDFLARVHRA